MKRLDEMSNGEFAELIEYIANYSNPAKTKTTMDFIRAYRALAGIEPLADGFKFFDRSSVWELLGNSPFMYAVYDQMIERLQPLDIDLTAGQSQIFESYAQEGRLETFNRVLANSEDSPTKVTRRLFDLGLISRPTYHGEMDLTDKGKAYFDQYMRQNEAQSTNGPKGP